MRCLDDGRTQLLIENTDNLTQWLEKDGKTDPELAYWIPKYILMRDKPFSELGAMSAKMKSLARNQDIIGWRNFTKGYTSIQYYGIQNFHLGMHSSYINSANWTQQFISKLLRITHSQWIFRNISLHDRTFGYVHSKWLEYTTAEIEALADTAPEYVPQESRFLLDINFLDEQFTIEAKAYTGFWQ